MGETGEPPPGGGPVSSNNTQETTTGSTNTTSAWAVGAGPAGQPRKQRSFAEIICEQKQNRNILEITLTKIQTIDSAGKPHTHKNLTFDEIGTFLFDIVKIKPSVCLRFNFTSGRYDTREVMFKPEVSLTPYLGSYTYLEHEIICRKQRSNISKITFKNVPLNIPDEEIVNLCETYGKPVDYTVYYEKMYNNKNRGMVGSTRYMDVELFQGASMFNYYWMEGPLAGDTGGRVTVLHPGQTPQCYNCLKLATLGCPGKGNGKACHALGTSRTRMDEYMEMVKSKHGYCSLKQKYYQLNPIPGGAGNFGIEERPESTGEEGEIIPKNPIEEKDQQLAALQKALEESRKEVQDITVLREALVKTKNELRTSRRCSSLARSKIEFARQVTEQRMSNCLSLPSPDQEDEIVSLYSALLDEESFTMEGNEILPGEGFLKFVEKKIEHIPSEMEKLNLVKNKILEKVKQNKVIRQQSRDRRDSVCSTGSKRGSSDQAGSDRGRPRMDASLLPKPLKS